MVDANFWQQWDSISCCQINKWTCYPLGHAGCISHQVTLDKNLLFEVETSWDPTSLEVSNLTLRVILCIFMKQVGNILKMMSKKSQPFIQQNICIVVVCGPGNYLDGTGGCVPCAKNTFSDRNNSRSCQHCLPESVTETTGAKSFFDCRMCFLCFHCMQYNQFFSKQY